MLIPAAVFATLFAGIFLPYWFFVARPEHAESKTIRRRLKPTRGSKTAAQSDLVADAQALSAIRAFDTLLNTQQAWAQRLLDLIQKSGAQVTVGALLLGSALAGLVAFTIVTRVSGYMLAGLGAAMVAVVIPTRVVKYLSARRMRQFETQFPEALDLMARALRAGHAFTTGLELVATEMPAPIGPEFRLLFDRQNYGMPMPEALHAFAERVPVLDAKFFVTAVLIQRESGGNLSEVLDNLSTVIRERQRVKGQMRVLSAHGRITGWVLVGLAPALGFFLMSSSPPHREALIGTSLGIKMLIAAAALQVIGTYLISRIVDVEY